MVGHRLLIKARLSLMVYSCLIAYDLKLDYHVWFNV